MNPPSDAGIPASSLRGFAAFDHALQACATDARDGRVLVLQSAAEALDDFAAHAVRRLRRSDAGRVLVVSRSTSDEPWVEASRQLAAPDGAAGEIDLRAEDLLDPHRVAEALRASPIRAIVVVDPKPTQFASAVLSELVALHQAEISPIANEGFRAASAPIFVIIGGEASTAGEGAFLVNPSQLGREEVRLFWEGVASDPTFVPPATGIRELSRWWRAAAASKVTDALPMVELSTSAAKLRDVLVRIGRSWPAHDLSTLGASIADVNELVAANACRLSEGGWLALEQSDAPTVVADEATSIAKQVLSRLASRDPWAGLRLAELHVVSGELDAAEREAVRALTSVVDIETRADFWGRVSDAFRFGAGEAPSPIVDEGYATTRRLRFAEIALRLGDLDRAEELVRGASAHVEGRGDLGRGREDMARVLLALGRVAAARGDYLTASVSVERALARTSEASESATSDTPRTIRARATAELAEIRFMQGSIAAAEESAGQALADPAADFETRALARNVIGKLHLARREYDQADRHFTADACEAACAGSLTAELRARLNRAIAVMSNGRLDEARTMLDDVRRRGEQQGEPRAVGYALANLATIAVLKHEYQAALDLLENTITYSRKTGDRHRLGFFVSLLAEVRLWVGLDVEAEQTLAFGRRACDAGNAHFPNFALVAARIQLSRGATGAAMRHVNEVLSQARDSGSSTTSWQGVLGARVNEAHRLAIRAALEDGDSEKARTHLVLARETLAPASGRATRAQAEVAVLEAAACRANGEPFADLARTAVSVAKDADDDELLREAHILLAHAAVLACDGALATLQVEHAVVLRDGVAASLPENIRERYLARRELAELARLETAVATVALIPPPPNSQPMTVRSTVSSPLSSPPSNPGSMPPNARRLVGNDPLLRTLLGAVRKVGPSDATVLIHGESGTGKELVAEAVHEASHRRKGPIVKVNCGALVETLLLSELFGHEKGAFTGAQARRRGRFEAADGGTLFLDEIGDISARTQVALLRVLQEKTFERVGGTTPIQANVRVVCATHRDLKAMVARGEFREDLYYRLCGVTLTVPALRKRLGDLPVIVDALLQRIADERGEPKKRLGEHAARVLAGHSWPGNVRELENALRAATLFAETDELAVEHFANNIESLKSLGESALAAGTTSAESSLEMSELLGSQRSTLRPEDSEGLDASSSPTAVAYAHIRSGVSLSDLKRQIERECIARALGESGGNITRAATLLGMKRPRLSQLVKQYGLGEGSQDGWDGSEEGDEGEEG